MNARLAQLAHMLALGAVRRANQELNGTSSTDLQVQNEVNVAVNSGEQTSLYHEWTWYNEGDEIDCR